MAVRPLDLAAEEILPRINGFFVTCASNYRIVESDLADYVPAMSRYSLKPPLDDLESRVAHRKHELITEIVEHKKNSSRSGAAGAIHRINHHLAELSDILKAGGWTKLDADARSRLGEWVTR